MVSSRNNYWLLVISKTRFSIFDTGKFHTQTVKRIKKLLLWILSYKFQKITKTRMNSSFRFDMFMTFRSIFIERLWQMKSENLLKTSAKAFFFSCRLWAKNVKMLYCFTKKRVLFCSITSLVTKLSIKDAFLKTFFQIYNL